MEPRGRRQSWAYSYPAIKMGEQLSLLTGLGLVPSLLHLCELREWQPGEGTFLLREAVVSLGLSWEVSLVLLRISLEKWRHLLKAVQLRPRAWNLPQRSLSWPAWQQELCAERKWS